MLITVQELLANPFMITCILNVLIATMRKEEKSIPEYLGKTVEDSTAWKKVFNTLFPQIYALFFRGKKIVMSHSQF